MGKHGVCMYCVQTKQTNCPKYGSQVFSMGARCVHCTDSTHSKLLLSLHKDDISTLGRRRPTELMTTTFLNHKKGSKVFYPSASTHLPTIPIIPHIRQIHSSPVDGDVVREAQMHHVFSNSPNLSTGLCNTHQYKGLISDAQAFVLKRKTGIFFLYNFQIYFSNMPYR